MSIRKRGDVYWVDIRTPGGKRIRRSCGTQDRKAAQWPWQAQRRNPRVYARGRVRHPDHATITLSDWHRVAMNTETETDTMRNLAFID